ncbi:MAG: hypothetical protein ACI857_002752 [Arenicella sp.]|jgi:hypothetical protein
MKHLIYSLCMMTAAVSFGQDQLPIYDNVKYIKAYDAQEIGSNEQFIESPFARPDLEKEALKADKKIKKVTYLYSHNNKNPKFGQSDLSDDRYENLMKLLKDVELNDVEWETKVQTGCGNIPCSKKLDHGFIIEYENDLNSIQKELNHSALTTQSKTINANTASVITGDDGTIIEIPANAFVDAFGNPVKGKVDIKLKEALSPEEIVLANLSTITNKGGVLQSKGMIELSAYQGNSELYLDDNKSVEVTLPTTFEEGFSFFEGEKKNGELVWGNPILMDGKKVVVDDEVGEEIILMVNEDKLVEVAFAGNVNNNILVLSASGLFVSESKYTDGLLTEVTIKKGIEDVTIKRKAAKNQKLSEVDFTKEERDDITAWFENNQAPNGGNLLGAGQVINPQRIGNAGIRDLANGNMNSGAISRELQNTFRMKKLGWANVDCLYGGRNSQKIRLNASQNEVEDLEKFSISLIVPSKNIFIPGYEKKDGNYSFTHGDYEDKTPMPVGESAFIIAMGDKDGETYFQMKKIRIGDEEVTALNLEKTDKDEALSFIKSNL